MEIEKNLVFIILCFFEKIKGVQFNDNMNLRNAAPLFVQFLTKMTIG